MCAYFLSVCLVEKHTQTKVKRGTQSHVSISTHFPSVGVCMYVRFEGRVTDGRGGVSYEEQVIGVSYDPRQGR